MNPAPETPSKTTRNVYQLLLQEQNRESPAYSFYSNFSLDEDGNQITYDEAIQQIMTLTNELKEFEKSSKELEDAMESELDDLNKEKEKLQRVIASKDHELKLQRQKMISMESELIALTRKNNELVVTLEEKLNSKNKALIDVEIQNDNFESNERIISNKLQTLEEKYNELLERNVILQGDMNEMTRLFNNERLLNSNNTNTIKELNNKIAQLEVDNERLRVRYAKPEKLAKYKTPLVTLVDNLVKPSLSFNVPKSSSMKQIHEMNAKTNELSQKADTLRQKLEDLNTNTQSTQSKKKNRIARFRSISESKQGGKENVNPSGGLNGRIVSDGGRHSRSKSHIQVSPANMDLASLNQTSSSSAATARSHKKSSTSRFFMAFKRI